MRTQYRIKISWDGPNGLNETDAQGPLKAVKDELNDIIQRAIVIHHIIIVAIE
jgi:hypothetical protein